MARSSRTRAATRGRGLRMAVIGSIGSCAGEFNGGPLFPGRLPGEISGVELCVFLTSDRTRGGRMDAPDTKSLPENAYAPLAEGETYKPIIPAAAHVEEATGRPAGRGVVRCGRFTIAPASA